MERSHEMVEGTPGKESPDAKVQEKHQENASSEVEQALEIILGIEEEQTAQQIQTMSMSVNDTKEKTLIDRAREFRAEFEAMKGEN